MLNTEGAVGQGSASVFIDFDVLALARWKGSQETLETSLKEKLLCECCLEILHPMI